MKMKVSTLYAAMFSAMIGVAGCSSDGDTPSTNSDANVRGVITGFGSVYVDGVEYETDGTTITIDGIPASESELHVGMLVNLTGSDDGTNGNALSIEFDDDLEGVVTANDATSGLVVMGHTITFDNSTNFDGFTDIAELTPGVEVEVSGYPDGAGNIHATYIELEGTYNGTDEIEVKGIVATLNETAMTFTIGSMTVDYSAATSVDAGLADGVYVEVKSESAPDATTGILTATKVELEDGGEYGIDGEDGEELEVEGLITALDGTTITVNGQTFTIPDGIDVSGFAVGDMIELDIDVVGTELVITEIEEDDLSDDVPGKIEVEAIVTATDTVANTITLGGVTISVDPANTIMMDHAVVTEQSLGLTFNLGSIVEGTDRVEVEAIPNADGTGYTAISLERTSSTNAVVELEGTVVIDAGSGAMSIAGVSLDVTTNSVVVPGGVVDGSEIHANGLLVGGVLEVTVIELED